MKTKVSLFLFHFLFCIVLLFSQENLSLISAYRTPLLGLEKGSLFNLKLASEKLNGFILKKGDIFSFLNFFSPLDGRNGFVFGGTLIGTNYVYLPGGGLCQMASTIYAAFFYGGFKILERHPHSVLVHHIFPGLDATVSERNFKDLKVENNLYPIVEIRSYCKNGFLYVELWGNILSKKSVKVIRKIKKGKAYLRVRIKRFINDKIENDYLNIYRLR